MRLNQTNVAILFVFFFTLYVISRVRVSSLRQQSRVETESKRYSFFFLCRICARVLRSEHWTCILCVCEIQRMMNILTIVYSIVNAIVLISMDLWFVFARKQLYDYCTLISFSCLLWRLIANNAMIIAAAVTTINTQKRKQ